MKHKTISYEKVHCNILNLWYYRKRKNVKSYEYLKDNVKTNSTDKFIVPKGNNLLKFG